MMMKYAHVTYTGKMRRNSYNVPGDTQNKPRSFVKGVSVPVASLEAAEWLEGESHFEVDWTARGRVVKALTRDYESPEEMLSDWGYRAKQSIAKAFGVKANQSEEDLEAELQEEVEQLQRQMEQL